MYSSFIDGAKALLRRARHKRRGGHGVKNAFAHPRKLRDHIGRTSTTSGTKCFNRFWMPCCSVAVEDGQPAQEPFILR